MNKKLAKLKYLPNNFQIIELRDLNYWNVELQEPYYSYVEASQKREDN